MVGMIPGSGGDLALFPPLGVVDHGREATDRCQRFAPRLLRFGDRRLAVEQPGEGDDPAHHQELRVLQRLGFTQNLVEVRHVVLGAFLQGLRIENASLEHIRAQGLDVARQQLLHPLSHGSSTEGDCYVGQIESSTESCADQRQA